MVAQHRILGIESSCDDTSIAVLENNKVLSNVVSSQWIHQKYGGVVPEAASRMHVEAIVPLCTEALRQAQINIKDLDAIAVTKGPGLIGSLLVGISFAKSLSLCLNKPLIEVNHLQAHVLSLFIDSNPLFPLLCLTVSGGHTQLILVNEQLETKVVGQTLDDAAGEAIDKSGKLLRLSYPAGPEIDKLAQKGAAIYKFPFAQVPGFNFSFSGTKTSILYFLRDQLKVNPNFIVENLDNLCASIQSNIVLSLIHKLEAAAKYYKVKSIGIAGGVSANSQLRKEVATLCTANNWTYSIPKLSYCTDNAAMIALSGYYKFLRGEFAQDNFLPMARYPLN